MLLLAVLAATAGEPKVETVSAVPPAGLAAAVRALLPNECHRIDGIGEFWLRDDLPARATPEQVRNGLTLRELPDGLLMGAVAFEKPFVDYRKQEIAAGVYTLRFAVQPESGDHRETAPHQEFALLGPAADDLKPDPLEAKDLFKLSLKATGGDHPGVMVLFPFAGKVAGVGDRKDGVFTLDVVRSVVAGEAKSKLGFGLTVRGHSKAR